MSGRVALLLLVTGLFAAAWSTDHPPVAAKTTPASPSTHPYAPDPVQETALQRWQEDEAMPPIAQQEHWIPTQGDRLPLPIPEKLPAGNYLVVDSLGHSERIVISKSMVAEIGHGTQIDDHYVSEFQGQRHHWIRLEDDVEPIIAQAPTIEIHIDWRGIWQQMSHPRSSDADASQQELTWEQLVFQLVRGIPRPPEQAVVPIAIEPTDTIRR